MGMTIDDVELWAKQNNCTIVADNWWEAAQDTINKYQQLQADYENRLNADLKAILVELQLEIEEIKPLEPTDGEDWQYGCFHGLELMQDKCLKLIQQKINLLKENTDGNDDK